MTNLPDHVNKELATLSQAQRTKFFQLLSWSGNSGFPGQQIDMITCEKLLDMVRSMGSEPIEPKGPEDMPNYNMEFKEHIGKWVLNKVK